MEEKPKMPMGLLVPGAFAALAIGGALELQGVKHALDASFVVGAIIIVLCWVVDILRRRRTG